MSEQEIPEEVLDRLKKLLLFKEDAEKRGDEAVHELENITARISEVLLKYNLDLENVKSGIKKNEQTLEVEFLNVKFNPKETGWLQDLWNIISKNNLCKVIIRGHKRKFQDGLFLVGLKVNREVVKFIVPQLENRIRVIAKLSWKDYEMKSIAEVAAGYKYADEITTNRNTYLRSFYLGAVGGINSKLMKEKETYDGNIHALIKRTDIELKEFIDENFNNLLQCKGSKSSSNAGYIDGYKAGQGMNIRQGLNESKVKRRLLK